MTPQNPAALGSASAWDENASPGRVGRVAQALPPAWLLSIPGPQIPSSDGLGESTAVASSTRQRGELCDTLSSAWIPQSKKLGMAKK